MRGDDDNLLPIGISHLGPVAPQSSPAQTGKKPRLPLGFTLPNRKKTRANRRKTLTFHAPFRAIFFTNPRFPHHLPTHPPAPMRSHNIFPTSTAPSSPRDNLP